MPEKTTVWLVYHERTGVIRSVLYAAPEAEWLPADHGSGEFSVTQRFLRRPGAFRVASDGERVVPKHAGVLAGLLPGGRLGRVLVSIVLLFVIGCATNPPAEIREGITLLRAGVSDYVSHEQPEIETRIALLRRALEVTTEDAERASIRSEIAEEESYLELGAEIPPALAELDAWALGTPLEEEGGDQ